MVCSHPDPGLVWVAANARRLTGEAEMATSPNSKPRSKIDLLIARLQRTSGATIDELSKVTGWQVHSVRGAMAGALKKKGHLVISDKVDGVRRYRLVVPTNE